MANIIELLNEYEEVGFEEIILRIFYLLHVYMTSKYE